MSNCFDWFLWLPSCTESRFHLLEDVSSLKSSLFFWLAEDQQGREFFGWPFKKKAGEEPGCLFFFFFHTGFLPDSGPLTLKREEIDKASKKGEGTGEVTLEFEWLSS